jgi:DNA polymerase-3 subunit beta
MEFETTREVLLPALAAVASAASGKATLPTLACVLLAGEGERLRLTATDLEMELSAAAAIAAEGSAAVPCRKLLDVVRALPANAPIRAEVAGERMVLKSGRSRFTLATLPADGFPVFDYGHLAEPAAVDPEALTAGLAAVAYAMAVIDVRYYLNGLLLQAAGGALSLVASDGHRLARFAAPCEVDLPPCIVPRGVVLELMRVLKGAESVGLAVGRPGKASAWNTLLVELPGLRIGCKLIEGRFPDFERVVPREIAASVTVDRSALLVAVDQGALLSSEKYKSVAVGFDQEAITIKAANPEHDEAEIVIAAELDGGAFETGFNAVYLAAALGRLAGDSITLGFPETHASCLVQDPDDGRQMHIVMPMRL